MAAPKHTAIRRLHCMRWSVHCKNKASKPSGYTLDIFMFTDVSPVTSAGKRVYVPFMIS